MSGRREYDFRSGELVDDDRELEGGAAAGLAGQEAASDGSIEARLRKIERQLSMLHRLVLELKAELEGKAGRAGVEPATVHTPPADQIRCTRCGFLVTPLERREGHSCKRRSADSAGWAARARAEIRPTTVTSSSDGEGAGDG